MMKRCLFALSLLSMIVAVPARAGLLDGGILVWAIGASAHYCDWGVPHTGNAHSACSIGAGIVGPDSDGGGYAGPDYCVNAAIGRTTRYISGTCHDGDGWVSAFRRCSASSYIRVRCDGDTGNAFLTPEGNPHCSTPTGSVTAFCDGTESSAGTDWDSDVLDIGTMVEYIDNCYANGS